MLRICVYHWLPVSDNILRDIIRYLEKRSNSSKILGFIPSDDAVSYQSLFNVESISLGHIGLKGKLNQRGFIQNVVDIPQIPQMPINRVIDSVIPEMLSFVNEIILEILPPTSKNTLAVLNEGIYSIDGFEAVTFEIEVDNQAQIFLNENYMVSIVTNDEYISSIHVGFYASTIKLRVAASAVEESATYVSENDKIVLFYSKSFNTANVKEFDSEIYMYCALAVYVPFVERVVDILKESRDHIIPLRRSLVRTLQVRADENSLFFAKTKNYLAYVNIKLPVILKVINFLIGAFQSEQFKTKVRFLTSSDNTIFSLGVNQINTMNLRPEYLLSKLHEDVDRLDGLYKEDTQEIDIISVELARVIQGNLLAENAQLSARRLETSRAALELDRGGKNRSNALMVFSFLASANLGVLIASEFQLHTWLKLLVAALAVVLAWYVTNRAIRSKASYFRLNIPIREMVGKNALQYLTNNNENLKILDYSGDRRLVTWSEKFYAEPLNKKSKRLKTISTKRQFNVSLDYEIRGYLHAIILETEDKVAKFDSRLLIKQLIELMNERMSGSGNFSNYKDGESSIYVEALQNIGLDLDDNLPALNRVLTMSSLELKHLLNNYVADPDHHSISRSDQDIAQDLLNRKQDYIRWFANTSNSENSHILGIENLLKKQEIVQQSASIMSVSNNKLLAKTREARNFSYDVALSFAGEDRLYVGEVATALSSRRIRVFYDEYEEANLWGKDLYIHLGDIYEKKARFCILFLSRAYKSKVWTKLERENAQARAFQESQEYILPVRLDDTEIPGVLPTVGYVDGKKHSPAHVADLVQQKLQRLT